MRNLAFLILRIAGQGVKPTISAATGAGSYTEGDTITLTVTATGSLPRAYQWKKNGTPIGGATAASHVINPAAMSHGGNYTCEVTNMWGSATSATLAVSVAAAPVPPSVYITGGGTYPVGTNVLLTAHPSGTGPITVTWLTPGGPPYPTGNTYTMATPLGPMTDSITCTAESPYGSDSAGATVTWT